MLRMDAFPDELIERICAFDAPSLARTVRLPREARARVRLARERALFARHLERVRVEHVALLSNGRTAT